VPRQYSRAGGAAPFVFGISPPPFASRLPRRVPSSPPKVLALPRPHLARSCSSFQVAQFGPGDQGGLAPAVPFES
jgi:hypothetical protein